MAEPDEWSRWLAETRAPVTVWEAAADYLDQTPDAELKAHHAG